MRTSGVPVVFVLWTRQLCEFFVRKTQYKVAGSKGLGHRWVAMFVSDKR